MKRFFLTVLLCAVAVSLFAGGKEEKSGGSGAPAGKTVEVVFWHSTSGATGEALENIIKAYNEGPGREKNIHVNLVYQGYEGTDKVILAYQTRDTANAPDINQGLTSTIPSVMDMGWSVSVERFLTSQNSPVTKNTFYPALQRSCTYEGEMAAIPFANSIPLLYYNVEMLREAGYSKPPETMDQLTEYVKKLTLRQGNNVSRYGLNMQTKRYQLVEFCVSQKPNAFFGDNEGGRSAPMTRITAGEDGTLRAFLEKLQKLLDTGGYKYVEDSINEEFAQGLSAMVIMSSSRIGTMDRLMPGRYMTAFLPKVNPGDSGGAAVGGSCLNLFDRGDNARLNAAWDVIQWCVSRENQYAFSTASGYIPVNMACEAMPEMQAYYRENPQYKAALDQMKAASPLAQEPLDLTYNEINGIITEVMLEFCQGKLDVNGAVAKIVAECNASLNEYHAAND
ncbi:MAG: extracellular solute-binding protein [Treponema sp.]|jgi:sn-glycerol 3-phosphate transport system substrate-binding protein|nr:extracellular solute-binding protein [Treponema sp.]